MRRPGLSLVPVAALLVALALPATAPAAPGDLDPAFSADGKTTTNFASDLSDEANAVAIQSDGKIVAAGRTQFNDVEFEGAFDSFGVARYNPDGSLDASFGGQNGDTPGTTTTRFLCDGPHHAQAEGVVIQPDGKIVVVGFVNYFGTNAFAVARYNTDGTPDTDFGGQGCDVPGTSSTDFGQIGAQAFAVALQPDGAGGFKIVVGGTVASNNGDAGIARFNPSDGSLDTSFGPNADGTEVEGTPAAEDGRALAIQPDRSIVGAGSSDGDFAVIRLGPDGGLDLAFAGGEALIDFEGHDDAANGVALQSDGSIVLAGYATRDNGGLDHDFALARLDSTGALDTGFGTAGKVLTRFGEFNDEALGLAVYPDDRIVAAGFTNPNANDNGDDFALARYSADGAPDNTFGEGGQVTTDFGGRIDAINGVALQTDGKVVVAGLTAPLLRVGGCSGGAAARSVGGFLCSDFALARYGLSAPPPASGGGGGGTPSTPTITPTTASQLSPCADDGTGPAVDIKSLQSTAIYGLGSKASVAISASDPSGLSVDPSDPARSLPTATAGSRTISAEAVDNCGNHGTTTFTYRVVRRPTVRFHLAPCRARQARVRVTVQGEAALREITARVDGGRAVTRKLTGGRTARGMKVRTAGLKPGSHTVTVTARDRLGNTVRRSVSFSVCGGVTPKFTG